VTLGKEKQPDLHLITHMKITKPVENLAV